MTKMTNKKLSRIVYGIVIAIMCTAITIGVAISAPKVGDSGGIMVVCNSPEVIEKIFRGGSDEVAITLFNEAREDGSCVRLPSPVMGEVTKIITSFVDHNSDMIHIVEIDGVVYTFTVTRVTGV
jgi:hypothetical protein